MMCIMEQVRNNGLSYRFSRHSFTNFSFASTSPAARLQRTVPLSCSSKLWVRNLVLHCRLKNKNIETRGNAYPVALSDGKEKTIVKPSVEQSAITESCKLQLS